MVICLEVVQNLVENACWYYVILLSEIVVVLDLVVNQFDDSVELLKLLQDLNFVEVTTLFSTNRS